MMPDLEQFLSIMEAHYKQFQLTKKDSDWRLYMAASEVYEVSRAARDYHEDALYRYQLYIDLLSSITYSI